MKSSASTPCSAAWASTRPPPPARSPRPGPRRTYEQQAQQTQQTQQRPPQQSQQRNQRQQQEAPPAQQSTQKADQAGRQVVELIHQALKDPTDPEKRLQAIRAEWGTRTLKQTPTFTKMWGELNADDLITRSLAYVKEEAEKRRKAAEAAASTPGAKAEPDTPAPPPAGQDQAREHQVHPEPEPPAEDDTPPPPDPQAEDGPPPGESPEDTTEAEEPQDRPAPGAQRLADFAAGRPPKREPDRKTKIALDALHAEADVQARVLMRTLSEHLAPISGEGEPEMIPLRNYLLAQRPEIIAQARAGGTHGARRLLPEGPARGHEDP
ncbi:Outer membrane biosynthesis protein TonB OS=Streptomyces griseomycini OX=66895 GN=FHS37_006594 PE=4 SV=1 [Streptomyces griseomycini]